MALAMDYVAQHGKVQLPPRESGFHRASSTTLASKSAFTTTTTNIAAATATEPPAKSYAEWYLNTRTLPLVTAEHFKQLSSTAGRTEEARLWSLLEDILQDAENRERYQPDVIGISATQPHRRWFISHFAHIQDLLMRHPILRRANVICRWLEQTYREAHREARLIGEEGVVLRQLLLTHLRGGELHRAIEAAVTYRHCAYSCLLSASQLQTVREPWFTQTALVPLFGEYANGELDQTWCGNEHRMDTLSQLFDESVQCSNVADLHLSGSGGNEGGDEGSCPAQQAFDAVIGAALCGNLEVLEAAFMVNGSWRDLVWCHLRCALIIAFVKTLMSAHVPVEGAYGNYIESLTGANDDWQDAFAQRVVSGLTTRLRDTYMCHAPLEEQLQMRVLLQVLSPEVSGSEWLNIRPESGNCEAARLISHTLLVVDAAYRETLLSTAVQVNAGDSFALAMAEYAGFLALLPKYPFDAGMRATIGMTMRLRSARHRAQVYAAFILAAREYELERGDLSRSQIEDQEARLVRMFVDADGDPVAHTEVQILLDQQVAPSALLTHNPLAERIMWEAMHADTRDDYRAVLIRSLEACAAFWLSTPQAELDAITDVSSILTRRVLPQLIASPSPSSLTTTGAAATLSALGQEDASLAQGAETQKETYVSEMEKSEATFWYLFSEARGVAKEHARVSGELAVTRAMTTGADRTLLFQLIQDEAALLSRLVELTQRAVRHGGAVVYRARQCLTAIVWLVQQLAEDVTLSFLTATVNAAAASATLPSDGNERPGPAVSDDLLVLQAVFGLVEELDVAGYLQPSLLSQHHAQDLFTQLRTMRVTYGRRQHRRQVQDALHKASGKLAL